MTTPLGYPQRPTDGKGEGAIWGARVQLATDGYSESDGRLGPEGTLATIVDLLENFFGASLTPDLASSVGGLSAPQLYDLAEQWTLFGDTQQEQPDQSPPLVAMVPRLIGPAEIRDMGGAGGYVASIANLLLYYPRVHVFHMPLSPLDLALRPEPHAVVAEFVRTYAHLRGLIERGAVVVSNWPDSRRTEPYIHELNAFAARDSELIEFVRRICRDHSLPAHMNETNVIDEYHITQVIAAETNTSWTAKYRALLDLHEFQLSRTNQYLTSTDRVELQAVDLFGRLELPAFSNFDLGDLQRIRDEEEAFVEWRAEMASIARAVLREEHGPGGLLSREFSQQARQALAPRVAAIKQRMQTKSLHHHARDATIGFVAGAVAAIATDPPPADGSLASMVKKPVVGGMVGLLLSMLAKRTSAKDRILYRFYSLFEEPRPAT